MGLANRYINEDSEKAKGFLAMATSKFREAKEYLQRNRAMNQAKENGATNLLRAEERTLKQQKVDATSETDETQDRNLNLSRSMYEMVRWCHEPVRGYTELQLTTISVCCQLITFPECVDRLFVDCLNIVNKNLQDLGLSLVQKLMSTRNATSIRLWVPFLGSRSLQQEYILTSSFLFLSGLQQGTVHLTWSTWWVIEKISMTSR